MTDKELIEQYDKQLFDAIELLRESKLQIEYLHKKFQETGSGNSVITRIDNLIDKVYKNMVG